MTKAAGKTKFILLFAGAILLALIVSLSITLAIFYSNTVDNIPTNVAKVQARMFKGAAGTTQITAADPVIFTSGWDTTVSSGANAPLWLAHLSNIPVVVRLCYTLEWQNASGTRVAGGSFSGFNLNYTSDFTLMDNGWYHYNKTMGATDSVTWSAPVQFASSITLPSAASRPAGATQLRLYITIEAMQQEFSTVNTGFIKAWSPGGFAASSNPATAYNTGLNRTIDGVPLTADAFSSYLLKPQATSPYWSVVAAAASPTPANSLMIGPYITPSPADYTFELLNNVPSASVVHSKALRAYNNTYVSMGVMAYITASWYTKSGSNYYPMATNLSYEGVSIKMANYNNTPYTVNDGEWLNMDAGQADSPYEFTATNPTKCFVYSQPVGPMEYVDILQNTITVTTPGVMEERYLRVSVEIVQFERSTLSFDFVKLAGGFLRLSAWDDINTAYLNVIKNNLQSPYRTWLADSTVGGIATLTLNFNGGRCESIAGNTLQIKKGENFAVPDGMFNPGGVAMRPRWRIGSAGGPELAMDTFRQYSVSGIMQSMTLFADWTT